MDNEEKQKSNINKTALITVVVAVIFGVGGFFGGMKYQQSKIQSRFFNIQDGRGTRFIMSNGSRNGFRPVNGEIINKDDKSITVKLEDGSSKIVILSDSTQINKAEQVGKDDLTTGEKVAVFGTENSDGSVTAQNIQLNPIQRNFQINQD